jgi:hypothetical protein
MTRKRAVEDSPARELLELLAGPFRAHAIYAAAKLGIADRFADGRELLSSGPGSMRDLAISRTHHGPWRPSGRTGRSSTSLGGIE